MATFFQETGRSWRALARATSSAAALGITVGFAWGETRLVPEEYPTIQAAIDASATGDTVLLSPGTYRGVGNRDIGLRGRDLVVKSRAGPEETIIDCEMAGRGFFLHEWETRAARIEGITIQNGYPDDLGDGGGVFCELSSPTIVDCRILNCWGYHAGGLMLIVFDGVVDRCVISGNTAYRGHGGGIWFEFGQAEIRNCTITGNEAEYYGGGVCFGGPGPNRLTGCTVAANGAHGGGGGIFAVSPILLERCIVWDNCSIVGGDQIQGGGGDIWCSDIDITGVEPPGSFVYEGCVYEDPMFCLPVPCGWHTEGDWSLDANSICLPEHSPCGELIGALGQGCGVATPTGACCFPDGSCLVLTEPGCDEQQGSYMGDETDCDPNPCEPTRVEFTTWGRIKTTFQGGGELKR